MDLRGTWPKLVALETDPLLAANLFVFARALAGLLLGALLLFFILATLVSTVVIQLPRSPAKSVVYFGPGVVKQSQGLLKICA